MRARARGVRRIIARLRYELTTFSFIYPTVVRGRIQGVADLFVKSIDFCSIHYH